MEEAIMEGDGTDYSKRAEGEDKQPSFKIIIFKIMNSIYYIDIHLAISFYLI